MSTDYVKLAHAVTKERRKGIVMYDMFLLIYNLKDANDSFKDVCGVLCDLNIISKRENEILVLCRSADRLMSRNVSADEFLVTKLPF